MNKNRVTKAVLILSAALALSACAAPLPSEYNGEATITQPIRTKHNCSLNVVLPNGTEGHINVGTALRCNGLNKGDTVKIVNGKYSQ